MKTPIYQLTTDQRHQLMRRIQQYTRMACIDPDDNDAMAILNGLEPVSEKPVAAQPLKWVCSPIISGYAIPISDKRFADEILVQRSRQIEGPPLWAVRLNGNCLNKSGEWEWEPMPSSRDDEFLARCRFESAESAIEAAYGISTPQEAQ